MDAIDIVVKVFHDLMSFHLFSLDHFSLCANINCIYNCSTLSVGCKPQRGGEVSWSLNLWMPRQGHYKDLQSLRII